MYLPEMFLNKVIKCGKQSLPKEIRFKLLFSYLDHIIFYSKCMCYVQINFIKNRGNVY